jgi:hypothetical protein
MIIEFDGVQLSLATAIPIITGEVSVSHEMTTKGGHVKVGEVLSSTLIFCMHEAEDPHISVAVQILCKIPVPMQPVI